MCQSISTGKGTDVSISSLYRPEFKGALCKYEEQPGFGKRPLTREL
jgi:hypothetical protein